MRSGFSEMLYRDRSEFGRYAKEASGAQSGVWVSSIPRT